MIPTPAAADADPAADPAAPRDRRAVRVLAAVGLLLVTLLTVPYALDQATLTYYLPSHDPHVSYSHTVAWAPGVVASVVALVATLAALGWLVLNVARRPAPRLWFVAGGVALLAVVVTVAVGGIATPAF